MNRFKPNLGNLIIYLIVLLSAWNLYRELQTLNVLSIAVSVIGLIAAGLYFLDIKGYKSLVWVWTIAQVVIVTTFRLDPENESGHEVAKYIFYDCTQTLRLVFGLNFKAGNTKLAIDFNALVLIYYFLLKQLKTSAHISKSYTMSTQAGSPLEAQGYSDLVVFITEKVTVDGHKNWLAGNLSAPIVLNGKEYDRVVIQVEDSLLSNFILAVPSGYEFNNKANSSAAFEAKNWLYIKR
ncbi:MAG: hypothetical protein EOP54_06405 [Sphingobacteriales bacterium]|nr:MAG: hypothetical protein EOP54_06405 [Sphingobacteriales bacterium]